MKMQIDTSLTKMPSGVLMIIIHTNGDTTFEYENKSNFSYTPEKTVRISDTMDITHNDSWRIYEPKGRTDLTSLNQYIASKKKHTEYPLNHAFECSQSCCLFVAAAFFIIRLYRVFLT
jgi:hypothetical protein